MQDATSEKQTPRNFHFFLVLFTSLVPLLGVMVWGWSLPNLVILYWIENLVIGFWTLVKMLTARGDKSFFSKLPICIFFIIHFGIFCMGHGVLLFALLEIGKTTVLFPFSLMIEQALITWGMAIGVAVMFLTQAISFFKDYWGSSLHLYGSARKIISSPYGHIVVVHIAIIAGAIVTKSLGNPMGLLVLLVIGKFLLDIKTQKKD